jgi:murein DD-endopeptidase MepM/ murein hydrolase activator NlpD
MFRRSRNLLLFFAFILSLLPACQSDTPIPFPTPPATTPSQEPPTLASIESPDPAPELIPIEEPTLEATAVIANGANEPGLSGIIPQTVPSPAPDPLRFEFPTPGPAPVSAWRPPLYATPWAPSPYDHFYFSRPIAADEVNWPLWNYRYGATFFADVIHTGIDIPVRRGTPVIAAGSGKVIWAGYGLLHGNSDPEDPYGLAISIQHDFSYQDQTLYTVYAHLDQIDVVRGQYVSTGDIIGQTGNTGHVTGPHLHFEVRLSKNDFHKSRNPELWLVPPQGWGVLVGQVLGSLGQLLTEQSVHIRSKKTGQAWLAKTYAAMRSINIDDYYQENLVIGDLPAGIYELRIPFLGVEYKTDIEIRPGMVTFFTFHGQHGFDMELPTPPGAEFSPWAVNPSDNASEAAP